MTPSARAAHLADLGDRKEALDTPGSPAAGLEVSLLLFCSQNQRYTPTILEQLIDYAEANLDSSYEIIVALDGHLGGLQARLEKEYETNPRVKVVRLHASQGQVPTIRAGIGVAQGRWIVTYPSFPQVHPEGIAAVLETLRSGQDYVVGVRKGREGSAINRLASRAFNRVVRTTTGVRFRDIACGLHGLRADVGRVIPNYGENQLFLPILLARDGYRVAETKVPADNSTIDRRTFSLTTFARRGLDLMALSYLVRFTQKPLRPFGALGVALLFAGSVIGAVLLYQRLVLAQGLADRPLLLLALLLMTAGLQVVILGFLGELLIYLHYRDQVNYRIHERFVGREDVSSRRPESADPPGPPGATDSSGN